MSEPQDDAEVARRRQEAEAYFTPVIEKIYAQQAAMGPAQRGAAEVHIPPSAPEFIKDGDYILGLPIVRDADVDQVVVRSAVPVSPMPPISAYMPISAEVLADSLNPIQVLTSTAAERTEWAKRAKAERIAERENAEHVELSLEALAEKLDWSVAYLEHLVQPYCGCFDGSDGWEYCRHAYDLGLVE